MFVQLHLIPIPIFAAVAGILTGLLTGVGTFRALRDLQIPARWWPWGFGLMGTVLGCLFVWSVLVWRWQSTPDVIPPEGWRQGRVLFHLSLISLLLIITATDLRSYFILDWCCWTGIAIAILGAAVSGQFQLAHVWVDWNAEIPQLRGPDIPVWLAVHPHLHGLAWSLAGLTCGVVATWLIRFLGTWILGMNALGSGDILLMGMIGAYLGWQPTLVTLLLAPILALGIGGILRLRGNHAALPYGPFLALAAVIIVFCWRFIWMAEWSLSLHGTADRATSFAVRRFFGDPISMLLVAALSIGLMVVLLGLLRIYHALPVGSRQKPATEVLKQTSEKEEHAREEQAKVGYAKAEQAEQEQEQEAEEEEEEEDAKEKRDDTESQSS